MITGRSTTETSRDRFGWADAVVVAMMGAIIYALIAFGREWKSTFHPATDIDLSFFSLPYYTLFSAMRGMAAFILSFAFTIVVGYTAAKSKTAEKFIIPALDILQSIPVLGFLPGLVLGLIAIFPRTNTGLELASVIMIFTGQVWNMTFSFYSSLKAVPTEFDEVSRVIGLSPLEKLWRVEFPFSAMNLAWNSLMSMSGGWFFLSVCEAFSLGTQEYRLPGLGAYMAVAVAKGNTGAMVMGVVAMMTLIILMDLVIWRPALAWVHQFRLEDIPGYAQPDPLIRNIIGNSKIVHAVQALQARRQLHRSLLGQETERETKVRRRRFLTGDRLAKFAQPLGILVVALAVVLLPLGCVKLVRVLSQVPADSWRKLLIGTAYTFARVIACLIIGSIWAVPAGIWIGTSAERVRRAQPIIQILASFPAPMLYPIALGLFFALGIHFDVGAMFLMLLGVQWYVLFNVLAGAMRIPVELRYAAALMDASTRTLWTKLYLPSVFPALVTGWVTAAGGAWNASIVAEYLSYHGQVLVTPGLGSTISVAASTEDFPLLAASLAVMVVLVIILNRVVWSRIYRLSQTRYRLDQ